MEVVGDRGYFQWAGLFEEVKFELTNEEEPDLGGEYSRWGQGREVGIRKPAAQGH